MLLGRLPNTVSLDPKGRLVIPSRVREAVEASGESSELFIGCLLDKCLYLHTEEQHAEFLDAFEAAVDDTEANRRLKTLVHSSFVPVSMDKAGRISVPGYLLKKAELEKEVVVIGMRERVEFWGLELYEQLEADNQEVFRDSLEEALARAGRVRRQRGDAAHDDD